MGFLGKIGSAIGKGLGNIAKGVIKFAKSPIGGMLMQVGLGLVTGGTGGFLMKGLSLLKGAAGGGGLLASFGGFASKFLGPAQSLLSKAGLSSLGGFLGKAGSPTDLAKMAGDLFKAKQSAPKADPTTQAAATENTMQLFAARQAQMLMAGAE